jgi:hypothetical protein
MRRLLLTLAAGLLLSGAADPPDRSAVQGPLIRVDPAGFDFGAVLPGKVLRKEFRLRNAGDQPLLLERVSTDCGCTVGKLSRTTLEPGGATSLLVSLTTPARRGRLLKRVTVHSNDQKAPRLLIKIQATVGEPPAD